MNTPSLTREKWNEAIAALMRRAATDVSFRHKCLTDPRGALKEISGFEPGAKDILRFVDPQEGPVFMLPPLRDAKSAPLSDAALESLSGGTGAVGTAMCPC